MESLVLPSRVREQQRALEIGFKFALPWQQIEAYVFDKCLPVATFERRSIAGRVIGRVLQTGSRYAHCFPEGKRCPEVESESLMDAFADVDSQLLADGWELVGRAIWNGQGDDDGS